jgi:hypothetical protein
MEKTISNMLKADYSTPQSLHRLEAPHRVSTRVATALVVEDTLHNDYRAFTRNLKIAAPQQLKLGEQEPLEDLIDDIYAYNYAEKPPAAESDYEKLKKAHKHLLDTYLTNKEQLLTMVVQLQKLQILLTQHKKERLDGNAPAEIKSLLNKHYKRVAGLLESVVGSSSTLTSQQQSEILGKLVTLL